VCCKGNHGNRSKPRSRLPGPSAKELAASAINKFTLDLRELATECRFAGFHSFSGPESHLQHSSYKLSFLSRSYLKNEIMNSHD